MVWRQASWTCWEFIPQITWCHQGSLLQLLCCEWSSIWKLNIMREKLIFTVCKRTPLSLIFGVSYSIIDHFKFVYQLCSIRSLINQWLQQNKKTKLKRGLHTKKMWSDGYVLYAKTYWDKVYYNTIFSVQCIHTKLWRMWFQLLKHFEIVPFQIEWYCYLFTVILQIQ